MATAQLHFRVLGPLEVWSGPDRVPVGGTRHERVLATLLLEANRLVTLPRLVDAAWDADPPATASHQVRKVVADLRSRLGSDLIATEAPGYRLTIDDDQLDLWAFDARVTRARQAEAAGLVDNAVGQLRAGLELWRGPALNGLGGPVLGPAAAALDERRLAATERLMDLRLALGGARELIGPLRVLLAEHPFREALRCQLMLALYRCGRQAEALRTYDEGRRLLAEELGIDPGPDLATLYQRILRNDPGLNLSPAAEPNPTPSPTPSPSAGPTLPAPAGPVQNGAAADGRSGGPRLLPYDLADFVGREEELRQVRDQVREAAGRGLTIVTIDGMAGVGKTTLAIHAAHLLAEEYPDGQLYLDLQGFTSGQDPTEPVEALGHLLRALGVASQQIPDDVTGRAALWRAQVAGRRTLVLLDNAVDSDQVRPLLPGTSGCLVIVTSRARLTGLDASLPLSLELFGPQTGLDLLARVLGRSRVDAEPEAAAALVEACGRLPLALRVVAARLHNRPQWTLAHLVRRLEGESNRLAEFAVGGRSVAAVFELSYRSLGTDQQRMFRRFGLHPGPDFDAYAAAALADVALDKAETLLEDLLDARLLVQYEVGRYTLHDLLRRFARLAVGEDEEPAERDRVVHRLLDYYLHTAEAAADLVQPGRHRIEFTVTYPPAEVPALADQAAGMAWFAAERRTLLAVVHYAAAHGMDQHACFLPRAMARYLQIGGDVEDSLAVLSIAAEASRRLGNRTAEGLSLLNLSLPYWHLGRFEEALDITRRALAAVEESGDPGDLGAVLARLGMLLGDLGRFDEALDHLGRAREIHRATGDLWDEASTLASQCAAYQALGRHELARVSAEEMVSIYRRLGDTDGVVLGLENTAHALICLGQHGLAMKSLEEAGALAREVGAPGTEAQVLARFAHLYRELGRLDEAYEHGRRALEVLRAIRRPALAAEVENTLGRIHQDRGEYELALERHRIASELASQTGYRIELARALDGIARALTGLGDHDGAAEPMGRARRYFDEMGIPVPAG